MSSKLPAQLKGAGYFVSSLSVLLLGIVAWDGASKHPPLLVCLIVGMAASVVGMLLRWISFKRDEKEKEQIERKAEAKPARQGL
jgi:hypothetical protein